MARGSLRRADADHRGSNVVAFAFFLRSASNGKAISYVLLGEDGGF
jgi:hypothetical protein